MTRDKSFDPCADGPADARSAARILDGCCSAVSTVAGFAPARRALAFVRAGPSRRVIGGPGGREVRMRTDVVSGVERRECRWPGRARLNCGVRRTCLG